MTGRPGRREGGENGAGGGGGGGGGCRGRTGDGCNLMQVFVFPPLTWIHVALGARRTSADLLPRLECSFCPVTPFRPSSCDGPSAARRGPILSNKEDSVNGGDALFNVSVPLDVDVAPDQVPVLVLGLVRV